MTSKVEVQNVCHQFGDFVALNDINLTIDAGEFAVLLGPSGCGKTTLLSILGGFIQPTSGSVRLDDSEITMQQPAERATTTVFQDYALFPHMSLLENVAFGPRMRGQSKSQRRQKALEMLALVNLESEASKKPHQLSGGQRQRVALARALAVEPAVLLLDEPLGALDLKLRKQMQDELKAIKKSVGTTFIHVTHDQEEAMAIADNIIVMNAGAIVDHGSPEQIYLKPKSTFSASFMGEMNKINGTVQSSDSEKIVVDTKFGLQTYSRQVDINSDLEKGDTVVVCFRPEHVRLNSNLSDSLQLLGNCVHLDQAFFGTHQRLRLQMTSGDIFFAHLPLSMTQSIGKDAELLIGIEQDSIVILREDR